MTMRDSHDRVQWVYESTNNQELEERYDQWASEYDRDLDEVFVWTAPETGARVLARLVPADVSVLDAGAGTGLVGKCLGDAGFTNMTAMDLSLGMLEEGAAKERVQLLPPDDAGRHAGIRDRPVRRRNQHRRLHAGTRAGEFLR